MPELPEAEANRRRVEDGALNRTVVEVRLGTDVTHLDLPSEEERARFVGGQFTETRRHGKYIFVGSATGPWIVVHLGMSGSLRVHDGDDTTPDYTRITFVFEGARRLSYRCPRKFGWVRVTDDVDAFVAHRGLGPDAMEIDGETFAERIGGSRGAVKSALLSQKKLAGIGNLWSDEALFQCGIAPDEAGTDLGGNRLGDLHGTMRDVLQGVLDTGAQYSDLPEDWLIHRRDEGADCPRCGGTIAMKKVGGRSAYHCATHQG
ncbi:Fpg/Nei family DNA glycosylase [Palleronia sp. LCG004]|uniref:Fpg/Nei family DNA glycosylase n=1 Tax=Palleronia sp. LCG004 TaxID=3079304 RepID=UPI00294362C9|nr:DNA-formamidopyrimidine glycosylase family protein [Palleronia sp. LCG004]WOI55744.1 DNA-formamidopyrimidine glycosylase family protein [Palleronia sp. LCG004]